MCCACGALRASFSNPKHPTNTHTTTHENKTSPASTSADAQAPKKSRVTGLGGAQEAGGGGSTPPTPTTQQQQLKEAEIARALQVAADNEQQRQLLEDEQNAQALHAASGVE